jgi:hypothetical protein
MRFLFALSMLLPFSMGFGAEPPVKSDISVRRPGPAEVRVRAPLDPFVIPAPKPPSLVRPEPVVAVESVAPMPATPRAVGHFPNQNLLGAGGVVVTACALAVLLHKVRSLRRVRTLSYSGKPTEIYRAVLTPLIDVITGLDQAGVEEGTEYRGSYAVLEAPDHTLPLEMGFVVGAHQFEVGITIEDVGSDSYRLVWVLRLVK